MRQIGTTFGKACTNPAITSVTAKHEVAKVMGMMLGAFQITSIFAPASFGYIYDNVSQTLAFILGAGFTIAMAITALVILAVERHAKAALAAEKRTELF